jgi:hypothetical protein
MAKEKKECPCARHKARHLATGRSKNSIGLKIAVSQHLSAVRTAPANRLIRQIVTELGKRCMAKEAKECLCTQHKARHLATGRSKNSIRWKIAVSQHVRVIRTAPANRLIRQLVTELGKTCMARDEKECLCTQHKARHLATRRSKNSIRWKIAVSQHVSAIRTAPANRLIRQLVTELGKRCMAREEKECLCTRHKARHLATRRSKNSIRWKIAVGQHVSAVRTAPAN